jgi:hypothetical protein
MASRSEVIAEVREHLDTHVASERQLLDAYAAIARHSGFARYLLDLLVEEETRHHRYFADIAAALEQSEADPHDSRESHLPPVDVSHDPELMLEHGTALLRAEQDDAKRLRSLKKALGTLEDGDLPALVVSLMELDTKKHIRIMQFLTATAARQRRAQRASSALDAQRRAYRDPSMWT